MKRTAALYHRAAGGSRRASTPNSQLPTSNSPSWKRGAGSGKRALEVEPDQQLQHARRPDRRDRTEPVGADQPALLVVGQVDRRRIRQAAELDRAVHVVELRVVQRVERVEPETDRPVAPEDRE